MRTTVAWAVVGLVVVATVLDTVFTAAHRSLWNEATWAEHGWPLTPMANLGCALMGALIVRRHPRHPIGWLLCVASLLSVTLAADAYGIWALDRDNAAHEAWGHVALWAGPLLGWPAFAALVLVFLIAPDGHLPSPRWRWAVWVTGTGLVLHTLGTLTTPPGDFVYGQRDSSRAITEPLLTVGVDARRGRPPRIGSVVGGAVEAFARRRTPPTAVDRRRGRAVGRGSDGDPGGPEGDRRRGDLAGRASAPRWPRSRCRSAWPSRCFATDCSRST